jgi:hypothetical protein
MTQSNRGVSRAIVLVALVGAVHLALAFGIFPAWKTGYTGLRDAQLGLLGIWIGSGRRTWLVRACVVVLAVPLARLPLVQTYGWSVFGHYLDLSWTFQNVLMQVGIPALLIASIDSGWIAGVHGRQGDPMKGFSLKTIFWWTLSAAAFFGVTRCFASFITLEQQGYVTTRGSLIADLGFNVLIASTCSCIVVAIALACRSRADAIKYGLPVFIGTFLLCMVPWFLVPGVDVTGRAAGDILGWVAINKQEWAIRNLLFVVVAVATLGCIRLLWWRMTASQFATSSVVATEHDATNDARTIPQDASDNMPCNGALGGGCLSMAGRPLSQLVTAIQIRIGLGTRLSSV